MSSVKQYAPRARQYLTVGLLVIGYAGYYLCRSDYSVALPLLIREFSARGIPEQELTLRFGSIASLGVLAYAIGKFPSGWLADFLGGRRNFLFGMGGSVLFTILFGLAGGLPLFTLAWIGNRLVQSLGWAGIVKIISKWTSYSSYGTVMGVISLSFLFGDAASRQFMSMLLAQGLGWRAVFYIAAATLMLLFALNLIFLRESPAQLGFLEPHANPVNLFKEDGERNQPQSLGPLLRTFARSPMFCLVCALSLGVTLLRETFNLWTPTYLTQAAGLTAADAAQKSALFPLFGGVSVLVAGFLSDKMGSRGRASIVFFGLLLTTGALVSLAFAEHRSAQVWLIAVIGFVLIGPYSFMAGAMSLDFGGKQGSATASGLIDGVGYLGGVLAGGSVARLSVAWGWKGAFVALAGVAFVSAIVGGVYMRSQGANRQ
jgi:OPA family glycerol-3-phosphate transporter-like MFS transporter